MWPPLIDLSSVNYAIWSVIQQRVYKNRVYDIDELRLLHVWHVVSDSLQLRQCRDCAVANSAAV